MEAVYQLATGKGAPLDSDRRIAYLLGIWRNRMKDRYRTTIRRAKALTFYFDPLRNRSDVPEEQHLKLEKAIGKLRKRDQVLMSLIYIYGLSLKEIAALPDEVCPLRSERGVAARRDRVLDTLKELL
ncbi:MAG: hypothetical protein R3E97_22140 [Candidatus Eisenbacteria bacterium]